jgi:hypothetical protein
VHKHVFCSDLCRQRGEPLAGLGDAPRRVLMLAWPRGKWRTPRWRSVDMSTALGDALEEAVQSGVHLALVDKVEAKGSLPTLHALPEGVHADFSDEAELIATVRNYAACHVFAGVSDSRKVILCCTDSQRDPCCARHGFSTYKALVANANPERFHIVQATHLGGCRFAASLLVMPQRQRYGRMSAEQAGDFIAALERDEIYLPAYRGRTDVPEPVQVAETAARRWAEAEGRELSGVEVLNSVPAELSEGSELALTVDVGGMRLAVRMHAENFLVQGNCSIVNRGGGLNQLRFCVDGVEDERIMNGPDDAP